MRAFIAFLLIAIAAAATDYKEIVLDPSYSHDYWNTQPKDVVKVFRAFMVSFDGDDDNNGDGVSDRWGQPEWVAYEIRAFPGTLGTGPDRPNPWIHDQQLFERGICPKDDTYRNSGFSRGHMCMKHIAFRLGANADWNTHTTLNACPQLQAHNAGIWLDLEDKTADWADTHGKVWVICGPAFRNRTPSTFIGDPGEIRIPVPDFFWKVVVRDGASANAPETLAFLYPHEDIDRGPDGQYPHESFLVSIDELEALTGLDFLTMLPDIFENVIEHAPAAALWP